MSEQEPEVPLLQDLRSNSAPPQSGKTAGIRSLFRNHVRLLFGFTLFSCVLLAYFCQRPHGSWRWRHNPMPCNVERKTALSDSEPKSGLRRMHHPQPLILQPVRTDILVVTPWLAPIVWEGTYNLDLLNQQFMHRNISIGLTVFAIKKYVIFLKTFLRTAEEHFMIGYRVNYYVFTDRPNAIPSVTLQNGRTLVPLKVRNYPRWQDITLRRMEMIKNSQQRFLHEVDYLVCLDVDVRITAPIGVEILSELFGTIHPSFYGVDRVKFPYERRPVSQAYIPKDEGDFYYGGAFFGGTVAAVYKLVETCHEAITADSENNLEAAWQEESHLNKYFLYHKPTKILSPEYLWFDIKWKPAFLCRDRVVVLWKNNTIK